MIVSAAVEIDRDHSASDTPRPCQNALTNAVKDDLRKLSIDANAVKQNVTMVEQK